MPQASWSAFEAALAAWRDDGVPPIVTAANVPLRGSSGRQVVASLAALGLLERDGRTGMALKRVVQRREGLVPELRRRWPGLIVLIEQGAPVEDVAAAFAALPASEHTGRRFRTFVLSACEREGLDVVAYRRLGGHAAPAGRRRARANAGGPEPALRGAGWALAAAQLHRELEMYEAALAAALEAGDMQQARAWSAELGRLRVELREEGH